MARQKLFYYLAAASGYIGIGLILGYALSDQNTNTPLWVGIILTLLGAILLGMGISARTERTQQDTDTTDRPVSSSGNPGGYPANQKIRD